MLQYLMQRKFMTEKKVKQQLMRSARQEGWCTCMRLVSLQMLSRVIPALQRRRKSKLCGLQKPADGIEDAFCERQGNASSSCEFRAISAKKNVYLEELKCGMFLDDDVTGVQDGYSTCSNRSQRSPLTNSDDA